MSDIGERRVNCPYCRSAMQSMGQVNLRTGGATGVAGMLFGGLNQLSENLMPVEPFVCPDCRRVEFYLVGR